MNDHRLPTAAATLWSRLNTTPLLDVLRGRLTGSLDLRSAIAQASLPDPLNDLVRRVARRTRLWRIERVDVARELAEHFRDGLGAGRSAEQLAESFGEPRQAARLIRRAKLRSRPLFWRIWRRFVQAIGAIAALVVASYLFLAIRLLATHPNIAYNYRLDLIAPTQGVPEADRAWPYYREALLHLTPEPLAVEIDPVVPVEVATERPGGKHWDKVERWLDENRVALEAARQGGLRPRIGFVFNDPGDDAWLAKVCIDPASIDPNKNEMLISLALPQINEIWLLEHLLEADAWRALSAGDRQALLDDAEALIGMAEQLRRDVAFLVVDLTSYAVFEHALVLVDEALIRHSAVLRDEDLAHLAHRIAGFASGGPIIPRLSGERAYLHDFVQRICSDDGQGGGVLTYDGIELLKSFGHELREPTTGQPFLTLLLAPLAGGILSRREMVGRGDALYDRAEAEMQRPLWQWPSEDYDEELGRVLQNPVNHIRYAPLLIFMPYFKGSYAAAQRLTQQRDATLVALALTLFHRRHAQWPARLEQLVPDLLPDIPADRFTGEPIQYRVVDGQPLLYSVGPDKQDNGGRPPDVPEDQLAEVYRNSIQPGATPAKSDVGWDWILWRPMPAPRHDEP